MSNRTPVPLTAILINHDSEEFNAISNWPFADSYVGRLLRHDIPRRAQFSSGRIWVYRDPVQRLVGFGTIDSCDDYREFTSGLSHPYIPLLAVNPIVKSLGYGTSIVKHLVAEAVLLAHGDPGLDDVLYLDVYENNHKAIQLYERCGFTTLVAEPFTDGEENGRPYIVMAKRLDVSMF